MTTHSSRKHLRICTTGLVKCRCVSDVCTRACVRSCVVDTRQYADDGARASGVGIIAARLLRASTRAQGVSSLMCARVECVECLMCARVGRIGADRQRDRIARLPLVQRAGRDHGRAGQLVPRDRRLLKLGQLVVHVDGECQVYRVSASRDCVRLRSSVSRSRCSRPTLTTSSRSGRAISSRRCALTTHLWLTHRRYNLNERDVVKVHFTFTRARALSPLFVLPRIQ
jgi:hypothetical protein